MGILLSFVLYKNEINQHNDKNKNLNKLYPLSLLKNSNKLYHLSLLTNHHNENGISIHGLWPDYNDGTYPSFCKKIPFDFNNLKIIEEKLLKYWELPQDINKLELSFWQHEWEKHGTCMFQTMTELEYFSKAIELYEIIINNNIDIHQYKKGKNYMIPFDLDFQLIKYN